MEYYYETTHDSTGRFLIQPQENSCAIPHFHSCFEILYVTDGELTATVNGVSARLCRGDLYVAGSYDIHGACTEEHSKNIVMIVPIPQLGDFVKIAGDRVFKSPFLTGFDGTDEILRCLEMLLRAGDDGDELCLSSRGYLYVIFGLLTQAIGLRDAPAEKARLLPQEILLYIQQNYGSRLTLPGTAERFGYSSVYFSRFFRRCFGCGFHEYLNRLRVQKAAALLDRRATFLSAALESGFENQRTFNRAFRKIYGRTPSEYRNDAEDGRAG